MNTYRITFASLYCKITITVIAENLEHALDVAEYDRATLFPDCTLIAYDVVNPDTIPDTVRDNAIRDKMQRSSTYGKRD
jgi:hypothetical protein